MGFKPEPVCFAKFMSIQQSEFSHRTDLALTTLSMFEMSFKFTVVPMNKGLNEGSPREVSQSQIAEMRTFRTINVDGGLLEMVKTRVKSNLKMYV